jgi:signal transduction histidine kinase
VKLPRELLATVQGRWQHATLRERVTALVVAVLIAAGAVVFVGSIAALGLIMKYSLHADKDLIHDTLRNLALIELIVLLLVLVLTVFVANRMVSATLAERQRNENRLRQFVADASHELRTPIAVVRGHAEFALRGGETDNEAMQRIHAETLRMGTLVENLLLLSRIDAQQGPRENDVDLSLAVLEAVDVTREAAPDHRWELDLPEVPVTIRGDEDALRRALANLIGNAARHTPSGTRVSVTMNAVADAVEIAVVDDGPGIDPALLPHIFERFVRGDGARTRAAGSTGLGLAIVHATVQSHGGALTVASRPGRTAFTLHLPRDGSAGTDWL